MFLSTKCNTLSWNDLTYAAQTLFTQRYVRWKCIFGCSFRSSQHPRLPSIATSIASRSIAPWVFGEGAFGCPKKCWINLFFVGQIRPTIFRVDIQRTTQLTEFASDFQSQKPQPPQWMNRWKGWLETAHRVSEIVSIAFSIRFEIAFRSRDIIEASSQSDRATQTSDIEIAITRLRNHKSQRVSRSPFDACQAHSWSVA